MLHTNEEIDALLKQYSEDKSRETRNEIAACFTGFAAKTARRFVRQGAEFDDLFQVAQMALLKALERFEPERGLKFTTFATPTIIGELKNYLRDHGNTMHLPRTAAELSGKLRQAEVLLTQELGRAPTVEEMANRLELTQERTLEIMEAIRQTNMVSLDGVPDEDHDNPGYWLGAADAGYDEVERRETVRSILEKLNDEERTIITLRFLQEKTQSEVGQVLGMSQMYVSRKERQIIAKLRMMMRET